MLSVSAERRCANDPLPPSAALPLTEGENKLSCCRRNLPLVRGRRERSERGGRSHTISNAVGQHALQPWLHSVAAPRLRRSSPSPQFAQLDAIIASDVRLSSA